MYGPSSSAPTYPALLSSDSSTLSSSSSPSASQPPQQPPPPQCGSGGASDASLSAPAYSSYVVCGVRFDVESHYRLISPIGHGAYGVVCSAVDTRSGDKVAIKKITKAFHNLVETKRTLREVQLLRCLRHANIVDILSVMRPASFEHFDDVYVVSELMSSDLHAIIASEQPLSDEHVQYFLYQILRGLKYLHSAHVIHRDLKPSNLLVNANCDLKIADFGMARCATQAAARQSDGSADPAASSSASFLTEYVATRWYRAPEIMLSWSEYSQAIDVWSVGCIFGELLLRRPLFPGSDYMHQLHLILDFLGSPSADDTAHIANDNARDYIRRLPDKKGQSISRLFARSSPEACHLLQSMLTFSPHKRITVEQALAHPYLSQLHDPNDEPVADRPLTRELFDESQSMSRHDYKRLLWQEVCHFHPDLSQLPHAHSTQHAAYQHRQQEQRDEDAEAMGVDT